MSRIQGDLKDRTFEFARSILRLIDLLPAGTKGWEIGRQILRSGSSIGANVREADHAISDREFVQKCSIARKEAAETQYWLELCVACEILPSTIAAPIITEADEITRILVAIVRKSHAALQRRGNE